MIASRNLFFKKTFKIFFLQNDTDQFCQIHMGLNYLSLLTHCIIVDILVVVSVAEFFLFFPFFQIPKLFQWLIAGVVFLAVWIALVFEFVDLDLNDSTKDLVLFVSITPLFEFLCVFCIQYFQLVLVLIT